MPAFSQGLEKALHQALTLANERHHEYATLEHLAARADRRRRSGRRHARLQRRPRRTEAHGPHLYRHRTRQSGHRLRRGLQADRRLPARHPARGDPCAVVRPRGSLRRQRARRDLRRAREPRRLFPAGTADDPLRRGQLHLARHRQASGRQRGAHAARRRGRAARRRQRRAGRGRQEEAAGRADGLLRRPQQEGARRARSIR